LIDRSYRLLDELLSERLLVLDGAMGTMLQEQQLTPEDFGGPALDGCNEQLVRTRPDAVLGIHRAYLAAGADLIATNSFGGTPLVLGEYGLAGEAYSLNATAARLARQAADEFSSAVKPRFVAGAMGPTTRAISVTGGVTFPQLVEDYHEQAKALHDGGADLLLLETCQDTRNVKAALVAIERLCREADARIPVMVSGTIEAIGTMLAGQTAEAFCASLAHARLLSIGLNCATGPEFMTDHIRALSAMTAARVSCHPNAGLPDEEGRYRETPESLARQLERFVDHGWLNIVGGCCGTTDRHIQAIAAMAVGKRPRPPRPLSHRSYYSGIELVEAEEQSRPLIVGERSNVIGSRLFKNLIAEEKWEEATEIARRQVKNGAHVIDVCLQSADRDELLDIPRFYEKVIRKTRLPLMIDSTDPAAIELALTYCQGKSIINSINLEDGESRFARVTPLARRYGAALVVGCIDEDERQAQAFTRERKLEVARRSYELLTERYGIAPEDIIIDPLVFPCATGDVSYAGGAVETISAIPLVKEQLPHAKTILGISNVSFGLPAAARELVNAVFLYHCTRAGLDLAIVNTEKIERFASIPPDERRLAEALLFNVPPESDERLSAASPDWRQQTIEERLAINQFHIAALTEHFRKGVRRKAPQASALQIDERIALRIVEGTRDGLTADLERRLAEGAAPLEIINGPLMAGMAEVGRLFNRNELIVAEVLQSAEVMKASVDYLEPFMPKGQSAARGTILLATVKGDVHDIGKNLVEIVLSNNGFTVVNLGCRVASEVLIAACAEHEPHAVGLSGLLVKSTQQMVLTAGDFRDAGIRVPLIVGGAALSEKFTSTQIARAYGGAVFYARDAMAGLDLMNGLMDPARRDTLLAGHVFRESGSAASSQAPAVRSLATDRSAMVRTTVPIPPMPYPERRRRDPTLAGVWPYLNPHMLFGRHLGYKGRFTEDVEAGDPKALELLTAIEELKAEAVGFMSVKAVWQFFPASRDQNAIELFSADGDAVRRARFEFARQRGQEGLCLSDYVLDPRDGRRDSLALFVVSAGAGIREKVREWIRDGAFFKAHAVQALALETAEAAAEWLHQQIRSDWGFPDSPDTTMGDRFTARYRGKRYSFGYPACPNLDDQQQIWKLLEPQNIGVELTDGMMMDPEASVSALVFHHPDCRFFSVTGPASS
jgi:5-methyltetrahydrofolate--homocysteine methyltransferase